MHTCMMHDNYGAGTSNCLQDGKRSNGIEDSPTGIANHRGLYIVHVLVALRLQSNHTKATKALWCIHTGNRLTQSRVKTENLVRVQTWIGARQNHNAFARCSHARSHLHQLRRCLVILGEFSTGVSEQNTPMAMGERG